MTDRVNSGLFNSTTLGISICINVMPNIEKWAARLALQYHSKAFEHSATNFGRSCTRAAGKQ